MFFISFLPQDILKANRFFRPVGGLKRSWFIIGKLFILPITKSRLEDFSVRVFLPCCYIFFDLAYALCVRCCRYIEGSVGGMNSVRHCFVQFLLQELS